MEIIPHQRHLFDIPDDVAYFNCGYMSPLMKPVTEAGKAAVNIKSQPWLITNYEFFDICESVRELFGKIVGACSDDIAIIPSASYGLAVAANNISPQAGSEILLLQEQFPSNVYPWLELAKRSGAKIRIVEPTQTQDGLDWTTPLLEAINHRTALATLPHCHWTDGSMVNLEAVGARLREFGAALVVDATQSAGVLPFSTASVKPDFLIAAAYKWLLGPYSLGFLYVAPHRQDGIPLEENWSNRKGAKDFGSLVEYHEGYEVGARRFDMGEKANFHLMPMAEVALRHVHEWGVENIQNTLTAKTTAIAESVQELGFTTSNLPLRAGHFLGLRRNNGTISNIVSKLAKYQVFVSVRGTSIRVTPYLYNTDADVELLINALAHAVREI